MTTTVGTVTSSLKIITVGSLELARNRFLSSSPELLSINEMKPNDNLLE